MNVCTPLDDSMQKNSFFALKIDMMKAYDRVEWNYLQGVLQQMGFTQGWIKSVMRCVSSVRYSVRVNGELTESFTPSRGLRQGDPISPYLFLLCAEGLSCLLKKEEHAARLKGVRNGRTGPAISHLLFADDSIFFTRADDTCVNALKSVLQIYSQGSGQKINLQKSSLYFGSHCPTEIKQKVMDSLNVHNESIHSSYLGMPTYVGQSKMNAFNFITEKVWKRVQGWSDRPLSRDGKEVMIKSVAQAIPTYIMSCFQLPDGICEKMRATVSNYWWGFEGGKKKMHWRSWAWMSTPKFLGGMGFRDMKIFNQAMLGRQCWRLITEPDSLCAKVLKGRYYPKSSFLDSGPTKSCSFTWRSLMHGKSLLERGILWRVGNGEDIRITKDKWVPDAPCHPIQPVVQMPDDLKVCSLIDESSRQWNDELVRICFRPADAESILNIPLS